MVATAGFSQTETIIPNSSALSLGMSPGAHRIQHAHGRGVLHGAHQNVGVSFVSDGHFAHADCRRPNHDVGIEQRQHAAMPGNLIAEQVGERRPERSVHLTDCDFRLRRRSWRAARNEGLLFLVR